MKSSTLAVCIFLLFFGSGAHAQTTNSTIQQSFDFRQGALNWQPGFGDYTPEFGPDTYELRSEIRQLPPEIISISVRGGSSNSAPFNYRQDN